MALKDPYDIGIMDIPIKKITTFRDELTPSRTSSPTKIADINLNEFLSKDELSVNDIDSLTAMTILNYLAQLLIVRCGKASNQAVNTCANELPSPPLAPEEMEIETEEWPLSPTKLDPSNIYTSQDGSGSHFLGSTPDGNETIKTPNIKIMQNEVLAKRFLLKTDPPVTVVEYLERINHYCELSAGVYLTSSLYLYNLVHKNEVLSLNDRNIHRILIAALRVSCKMIEDINHRQSFISKIGGISDKDLLSLEISFLFLLKFECQVNETTLSNFLRDLKLLHDSERFEN